MKKASAYSASGRRVLPWSAASALIVLAFTSAACSSDDPGAGGAQAGSGGQASAAGSGPSAGSPSVAGNGSSTGGSSATTGGSPATTGGSPTTGGGSSTGGSATGDPLSLSGVETPGADCPVGTLPEFDALKANEKLPNPFQSLDGSMVTTRAQWVCRHHEISQMIQHYETGPKETQKATTSGSFSGNSLKIDVTGGTADVSFSVTIDKPSGSGPFPALIGLAGGSLDKNHLKQLGVAIINFQHNQLQPEGNRSGGLFAKFHGTTAGSLIAWSWGASRIIDALEKTPDAGIDPKRLAITGCSRDGKGAMMIGAMDSRFALVIPQESGSGGVAAWRVSEVDNKGQTGSAGVQNLSRTYTEQQWFGEQIAKFGSAVTKLPVDHHELVALVAPRGLLILGNLNYTWLSTNNSDQSGGAARLVYEALGAKSNIGFVDSGHNHCGTDYAGGEQAAIDAFVNRFLLNDMSASTDIWKPKNELDPAKWVDWTAPDLTQ